MANRRKAERRKAERNALEAVQQTVNLEAQRNANRRFRNLFGGKTPPPLNVNAVRRMARQRRETGELTNENLQQVVNNLNRNRFYTFLNAIADDENGNNRRNAGRTHSNRKMKNTPNVNGRVVSKDRSMTIIRKDFGKAMPRRIRGTYRSKTSCQRLPVRSVQELAKNRKIAVNPMRQGRKGPHSSSRPQLCREMYGFKTMFALARQLGITKTEKRASGSTSRRYKTVDEIQREIETMLKSRRIPKKYSYQEIINRGIVSKGTFAPRGGRRRLGSLNF
jgi:hypothetical protein